MMEENKNIPENEEINDQKTEETLGEIYEKAEENTSKQGLSIFKNIVEWLETFAFAFAFVIVVFTFMFKIVTVEGRSMHYTFDENDKLIISDLFYEPKCGDVVVIQEEFNRKAPIIKRVIATEGQTVKIDFDTWAVYVDGELLDEPYINPDDKNDGYKMEQHKCTEEFKVAEGHVFVLGDNRNNSADSRFKDFTLQDDGTYLYTGFTEDQVLGRVVLRLTPLDKFGIVKPATDKQIEKIKKIWEEKDKPFYVN